MNQLTSEEGQPPFGLSPYRAASSLRSLRPTSERFAIASTSTSTSRNTWIYPQINIEFSSTGALLVIRNRDVGRFLISEWFVPHLSLVCPLPILFSLRKSQTESPYGALSYNRVHDSLKISNCLLFPGSHRRRRLDVKEVHDRPATLAAILYNMIHITHHLLLHT